MTSEGRYLRRLPSLVQNGDVSDDLVADMTTICRRYGSGLLIAGATQTAGVAEDVVVGAAPLNGLRHRPDRTSGWFLWAGRGGPGPDASYFKPIHIGHLVDRCPEVMPYLALEPGWRFLIAPGHEDVWFDAALLDQSV